MSFDKSAASATTTPIQLWLAWGFVGIPLIWGVSQTIANALKLFQ